MADQDVALREAFVRFKKRAESFFSMISAAVAAIGGSTKTYIASTLSDITSNDLTNYTIIMLKSDANGDFALFLATTVGTVDNINIVQDAAGNKFQLQSV